MNSIVKLGSLVNLACQEHLYLLAQSMLSPRRDIVRVSKSVTNTPFRRADSDPLKQQLNFNIPLSAPSSPYHHISSIPESPENRRRELSDLVKTKMERKSSMLVSVGVNTELSGDMSVGDRVTELNIEDALTDELKILQVCRQCQVDGVVQ